MNKLFTNLQILVLLLKLRLLIKIILYAQKYLTDTDFCSIFRNNIWINAKKKRKKRKKNVDTCQYSLKG